VKTRLVDARQGARWLAEGWRLFRAAPFAWAGALAGSFALLLVLGRVPLVGAPLFVILTPALWAAFMAVARTAAGRGEETPAAFVRTLGREARPLAALGVAYLAANVASIAATIPFGEGLLAAWVFQGKAPPREQVESAAFLLDIALSLVFYAPAMLAYWFAPMLVAWHGTGAAKRCSSALPPACSTGARFAPTGWRRPWCSWRCSPPCRWRRACWSRHPARRRMPPWW
jgi:hypothetical protein